MFAWPILVPLIQQLWTKSVKDLIDRLFLATSYFRLESLCGPLKVLTGYPLTSHQPLTLHHTILAVTMADNTIALTLVLGCFPSRWLDISST